jgi:maltooligosyltrehalose trehalohydrolase
LELLDGPSDRRGARSVALAAEEDGYFSGSAEAAAGQLYAYRLDDEESWFPDPASRFQPHGPSGPSQIIDPRAFNWTDNAWRGLEQIGQVTYEMHIGTFTPEGTWQAATQELPELARAGMNVLEIMPVADFPGQFGWGYDGVCFFAPTRLYGTPDDFRRFVDRAHGLGMGVILDVVYNHFGNFENSVTQFSDEYYTDRYENEWAKAINFDGEQAGPVREFFVANARYWIDEFHLDGYRFDATQSIFDASAEHILAEIAREVREAAGHRSVQLSAENERQEAQLARPVEAGGYGMDMLWNDDFHHSAVVCLTRRNEAYYSDYAGSAQELLAAIRHGYLYQGQLSAWQGKPRGTPSLDLPASAFVSYLENHDQVANSADGSRLTRLCSPARHRAMTTLWLLAPQTPLFFQGQEFSSSPPFLYFADHAEPQARLVAEGRGKFLSQFPSIATPEAQSQLSDPADPQTFQRCKLNFEERGSNAEIYRLHCDLLRLRREDPVFRRQRGDLLDGAVLSPDCLVLRFFDAADGDRLLMVNFGGDLTYAPGPQPLLAPPADQQWQVLFSSESLDYGGQGTPSLEPEQPLVIRGDAALVLKSVAV